MMGDYPDKLLLIGVQPVLLEDFGGSLAPEVKAQIQPAIEIALSFLQTNGIGGTKRHTPLTANIDEAGSIADMELYEKHRPSELEACRTGDTRVIHSEEFQVEYRPADIDGVSVALDQHLDPYRTVQE
jgi:hydrogenase maturation protease